MLEFDMVSKDVPAETFNKYKQVMNELLSISKCDYCEVPLSEEYYYNENYIVCEDCSKWNRFDGFQRGYLENYVETFRKDYFRGFVLKRSTAKEVELNRLLLQLKRLIIKLKDKFK